MAQLVVRDLEDKVKEALQRRARKHGRSMEAEIRDILRSAVADPGERVESLGTRLAGRFAGIGLDEPLPEIRGHVATPVSFSE